MHKQYSLWDSSDGYGLISRIFHWLMALLFVWQFASAILRVAARDTPAYQFFWSAHYELGFTLLLLVCLRGIWGLVNLSRRPRRAGAAGWLAGLGHVAIYALMFAIPALALLRVYGRGRGFSYLGIEIFEPTGVQDAALTAPANAAHGLLGWVLLVLIIGHVAMALIHHFVLRDDTLRHMAGRKAIS